MSTRNVKIAGVLILMFAVALLLAGFILSKRFAAVSADLPDVLKSPMKGLFLSASLAVLFTGNLILFLPIRYKRDMFVRNRRTFPVLAIAGCMLLLSPLASITMTHFVFQGSIITGIVGAVAGACACIGAYTLCLGRLIEVPK